jgi:hypothetical protein
MRNVLTRDKITTGEMIPSASFEGIGYGITIKDVPGGLQEQIMAKPEDGSLWSEMSNTDKLGIIGSIVAVFMDRGYTDHAIDVKGNCFTFRQTFATSHLVNTKPGLVTIAGGMNVDPNGIIVPFPSGKRERERRLKKGKA